MTAPSAPSPGLLLRPRFDAFIEALCAHIAGEGAKRRIAGPLIILIWQRLRRLAARFARLVTTPPRARATPPRARITRPAGRPGAPHTLPRAFGWLARLIPGTASVAAPFRALLDTPDMAALIAATPEAGRILRPLCHTLGIRPPAPLRRPRQPRLAPPPEAPSPELPPRPEPPAHHPAPPPNPAWPRAPGATRFNPPRRKKPA
ncbi:hypothetical protein [Acidiphilium multivorum]|uniref:hypothetical protein n=1 Tax=Acidiphilium multivorum TaxID=62140 RepID=UPI0012B62851|nr:hypothetical protein [Acidiphilium multivorum]